MSADVGDAEEEEDLESPNIGMKIHFDKGDVETAFAESDIIVEETYRASSVHQGYLEPHAAVASFDLTGTLTLWTSTQGQFRVRQDSPRYWASQRASSSLSAWKSAEASARRAYSSSL